jgi:GAF domain-containing protein
MSDTEHTSEQAHDPDRDDQPKARADTDPVLDPTPGEQAAGVEQHLLPDRLCRAVADMLDVEGAAISVYLGGDIAVPVGANNVDAAVGEALQFTVREGPCFESYTTRQPVLITDLHDPTATAWTRWPTYAAQLTQHTSYQGVFAYPLLASGVAMGSLSLYRCNRGDPGDVTGIAARVADRLLAAELFSDPDGEPVPRWLDSPSGLRRRLVWQAQGLTVQANRITPGQAIDLLRAQAYSADRVLDDVADDIMSGRMPVPVLRSDS